MGAVAYDWLPSADDTITAGGDLRFTMNAQANRASIQGAVSE
jgi:hypothetical protein